MQRLNENSPPPLGEGIKDFSFSRYVETILINTGEVFSKYRFLESSNSNFDHTDFKVWRS
jgi:hypothetical protein